MSAEVLLHTLVVRNPETDAPVALVAGTPVPDWARDLVHPDDLADVEEVLEEENPVEEVVITDDMSKEEAITRVVLGPGASDEAVVAGIDRITEFLEQVAEDLTADGDDTSGDGAGDGDETKDKDADGTPPAAEPVDYSALKKPELEAEVAKRDLTVEGKGNVPDLVAALVADDAAKSGS